MKDNVHWHWRHPKLALATFWLRWLIGWPLYAAFMPIAVLSAAVFAALAWLRMDHAPWELAKCLRQHAETMRNGEGN